MKKTTPRGIGFSVVAVDQRSGPRLIAAEIAIDDSLEHTSLERRVCFLIAVLGADCSQTRGAFTQGSQDRQDPESYQRLAYSSSGSQGR